MAGLVPGQQFFFGGTASTITLNQSSVLTGVLQHIPVVSLRSPGISRLLYLSSKVYEFEVNNQITSA